MAKIYSIASRKGGTGKTTTCGALSSYFNHQNKKVLAIDMDPQGDLSDWSDVVTAQSPTIFDVLVGNAAIQDVICKTERYDLIPANSRLSLAERELIGSPSGMKRLANALDNIKHTYDLCFIDCPRHMGIETYNALAASNGVIIVTDAGKFATKGLVELSGHITEVSENLNSDLKISGVLLAKYNSRYNINKTMAEITQRIAHEINAPVYESAIRCAVAISEAQVDSEDIFKKEYDTGATQDYREFCKEFARVENI